MLIQPRQAKQAIRHAPLQERKSAAASAIRGFFAPSIKLWVDAARDPRATGTSMAGTNDRSGNSVSVTQVTASKQPLKSAADGVAGFSFDGVNDCLQVASIDLSTTKAVTIADVRRKGGNSFGFVYEMGSDTGNSSVGGYVNCNENANAGQDSWVIRGDVGFSTRVLSSPPTGSGTSANTWVSYCGVLNKAAPVNSEVSVFKNGAKVTSFASSGEVENTNFFANQASFIGSRNNGAAVPMLGHIAQLIVINKALSDADGALLSLLLRQAAGVP